jgi:bromodomain adjacent to zinc finger domain protein 1A
MSLRDLPIDNFTLSEVLRLHLLASGASTALGNIRWQYQQRGGYTACDDPGLELKRNAPGLMKLLADSNVFDLDPGLYSWHSSWFLS